MSADLRLLTSEQLSEMRKTTKAIPYRTEREMMAHERCTDEIKVQEAVVRALLDHIAAIGQQRAEALEITKILPHEMGCCWTNCNCSRGLLIKKLEGKE